jgi:uroporphyrinogen-III decarboxylase
MEFEEPDVVPLTEQAINSSVRDEILGIHVGPAISEAFRSLLNQSNKEKRLHLIAKNVYADFSVHVKADLDMIWAWPSTPENWEPVWLGENTYLDEFGRIHEIRRDMKTTWYKAGAVKNLDDWEKIELDPYSPGRMDAVTETLKLARARGMCVVGTLVCGVLSNAYLTCGMSRTLQSFYKNPDFISTVMDDFSEFLIEIAKRMIDLGVDVLCIGDDLADTNGPLISPAILRKFVFPLLKRINEQIKKRGKIVFLHSDGNLYPILDDIINAGYDGIHAIEPQAGMDIQLVKERYGDKLFLIGNVDCSHTLSLGSVLEVKRETKEVIRKASPGGGHILSSSNSIHNAVKVENFLAMIKTAKKYGRYGRGQSHLGTSS